MDQTLRINASDSILQVTTALLQVILNTNNHKANIPLRIIVSIYDISIYKLANFLTRILQLYCGNNFQFIKDSKGLAESLKEEMVDPDKLFVSFVASVLFPSILVPVALEVRNRRLPKHINENEGEQILENTCYIPKDTVIYLLELVLNNCVFSFQGIFYQHLQGVAMGSSISSVITTIYMEYLEELALGPDAPLVTLIGRNMWITLTVYLQTNS